MNIERRFTDREVRLETREGDMPPKIVGYGAVFNSRSEDLGGFTEIIAPGAFDSVLDDDVRGLFNHDENIVLGRTVSGTMNLSVDETGLRYEIIPPDTQLVRDMVISPMKRGDVSQSSFGFFVEDDEWKEESVGVITRTITKVGRLLDVSPVTYPAYPDTKVAMRKLTEFVQDENKIEIPDEDVVEMLAAARSIISGTSSHNHRALLAVIEKAQAEIVEMRTIAKRHKQALEIFQRFNQQ